MTTTLSPLWRYHHRRNYHFFLWMQLALSLSVNPFLEIPAATTEAFSTSSAVVPRQRVHLRSGGLVDEGFRLWSTTSSNDEGSTAALSSSPDDPSSTNDDDDDDSNNSTQSVKKEFVSPATIQFNNKLNSMARNYDETSAQAVETLLRDTLQQIEFGLELEIEPNVVSFTAAISAWARSSHKDAAQKAEAILDWMTELSTSPDHDHLYLKNVAPNAYAYNAAISAWIRSRSQKKISHTQAERLFNQLWEAYETTGNVALKPDARSFNMVINAIARSREPGCADRAAALLNRMEELYLAGDEQLEPDALTFGAIINAYANAAVPGSSDKAAQILQRMESLYQLGYKSVKPNTFVYNACLNAFAKSSQRDGTESGAMKASQLLRLMEQQYSRTGDASVKPDVITYSTCINAHASSKSVAAGEEADALIQRMTSLYLLGDTAVKPNAIAYTASIKAWVVAATAAAKDDETDNENEAATVLKQRAAKRAVEILQLMCLQFLAGDPQQKPTKPTFDLVCQALSDVNDQDKLDEVGKIRNRMMGKKLPRRNSV